MLREAKSEVDALRKICDKNGIDALVERSRSGGIVTLITMDPEVVGYEDTIELKLLIDDIKRAGIVVRTTNEYSECYAVIAGNSQLLLFFHGKILP